MGNTIFAENVKYLRELEALKQSEMLDVLGFKQTTWNGYERGGSTPSIDDLIKISDFFGILESDLLRTEISSANIEGLYNSYISRQPEPQNTAATLRAKNFINYYNTHRWVAALAIKAPEAAKPGKKKNKAYATEDQSARSLLNEPGAHYQSPPLSPQLEARIARLEAIYSALKDALKLDSL